MLNAGVISLGCSKNQVDTEMVLGYLKEKGINITNETMLCDILIINTCGFINSAKEESINTILEMSEYKEIGNCKYLIVIGCLAKRYKEELIEEIPEIDLVISLDEYDKFDEYISNLIELEEKDSKKQLKYDNRVISTNYPMAYLRIADGCDNCCSYCTIPLIRGKLKSRKIEDILEEAQNIVSKGIREINIIAQDTSRYGKDIYNKLMLGELLEKLADIEELKWVRVLYMYPDEISDELIEIFKNNTKILPYFDIPIQHTCDRMLKLMNRRGTKAEIFEVIEKIRKEIPDAIIRTTIIVGFPGETDEEFNELIEDIEKLRFDRLGAFTYSREEDTKSYDMEGQVPEKIKKQRLDKLMKLQRKISREQNSNKVGQEFEVVVEDVSPDEKYFSCRSYAEAPDVDNKIYVPVDTYTIVGGFYKVRITDYSDYDLYGEVVKEIEGE